MIRNKAFLTISMALAILSFVAGFTGAEEAYKYKNPAPKFKQLSKDDEARLAPTKLGTPPKLTEKQLQKIEAGEIVIQEVSGSGEGKRYEAVAVVKAPPKAVMAFLKDFASYVGPMPNLKKIEFSWEGNLACVTQHLKVTLSSISYRLNILHYGDAVVEWEFVDGDIKDTTGYYKLFPRSDGRETLLVYHVCTDPGMAIPQFIMNLLTKKSMPDVVKAIREEAIKRVKK
jgi:hypothetical protein